MFCTRLTSTSPSWARQQLPPCKSFTSSSFSSIRSSLVLYMYVLSPSLSSRTVLRLPSCPSVMMCWARQVHPFAKEQSTTFPIPVFSLSYKAASVPVMPSDADTKSAIQFEGNWLSPGLLMSGIIPLIERQFKSWPGRRARGPLCPYPLTLRRTTLLLISQRSLGPSFNFSSTPGRQGSMIISAFLMSILTSWKCSLSLRLIVMHFLFLFMMFLWMGMETGTDSERARRMTSAPWSAKYIPQKTLGANPSNSRTFSLFILSKQQEIISSYDYINHSTEPKRFKEQVYEFDGKFKGRLQPYTGIGRVAKVDLALIL